MTLTIDSTLILAVLGYLLVHATIAIWWASKINTQLDNMKDQLIGKERMAALERDVKNVAENMKMLQEKFDKYLDNTG